MSVYDTIGVRTIINARHLHARLSALLAPVTAAMQEAAQCASTWPRFRRRGKIIAEVTGAEAGIVTSGAARTPA
jgi:L-cysteine desulfidase